MFFSKKISPKREPFPQNNIIDVLSSRFSNIVSIAQTLKNLLTPMWNNFCRDIFFAEIFESCQVQPIGSLEET